MEKKYTGIMAKLGMRFLKFIFILVLLDLSLASRQASAKSFADAAATDLAVERTAHFAREHECLATAIAYEAGYESLNGRRAVAEVILNRTRSGFHPVTVCGVVYEGSARRTGCQFTFTCDGSLRRRLPSLVVTEARQIASEALSGFSPIQVDGALNYHADYVTPYWAATMLRITKIGRHIFYRRQGGPRLGMLQPRAAAAGAPSDPLTQSDPTAAPAFAPWGLSLAPAN